MSATARLLARLWPLLSIAGAAGCANKGSPTSDVPPSPTDTTAHAASTSVVGQAATTNDPKPAPSASAPLARCRACNLHCYAHGPGETCLPGEAGAALDARVGCAVYDKSGPHDDGKQCCYGGPCPGRPLLLGHTPSVAALLRDASTRWG